MSGAWSRIWSIVLRNVFLHRRSLLRSFEIIFWPLLELLVWGFVAVYFEKISGETGVKNQTRFMIGGMIFWHLHYRTQQGIIFSLMEEVWTKNITNLMITPLRRWEWFVATIIYQLGKTTLAFLILSVLASVLYSFNVWELGWTIIPILLNLLFFAWSVGLLTAGFTFLFGFAAEPLVAAAPFILLPISAVFYPVEILPEWMQWIPLSFPNGIIFEDMRAALNGDHLAIWRDVPKLLILNVVYAAIGMFVFGLLLHKARISGRLCRLGQE